MESHPSSKGITERAKGFTVYTGKPCSTAEPTMADLMEARFRRRARRHIKARPGPRRSDHRPATSGLPPDKQTFSDFGGMPRRCQQETHAPQQFYSLSRRHVTRRRTLIHDALSVPAGKVNCKMVPRAAPLVADSRPPCASMI